MVRSVAEHIWSLNWDDYFPHVTGDGIKITRNSLEKAEPFIKDCFPKIYQFAEGENAFGEKGDVSEKRRRYYDQMGDFFLMENGEEPVGLAIGSLLDWTSYNFRNIAIMPQYQGKNIYFDFFSHLAAILSKHGVKRIEGDVAPSNRRHIHVLNKMGYMVTSLTLSERWGAMLHITKYLDVEDEEYFGSLFSGTHASDMSGNNLRIKKVR